jgi:hypothetical protein
MNLARLSDILIDRLYTPQEMSLVHISFTGYIAAEKKSMKNVNDLIGNRTCNLSSYSAVPQPTVRCIIMMYDCTNTITE